MNKQRAFTMIELLVVLAIIAVLVGLLFPAIGAVRRTAKQAENNTKVRNIVQGTIQYSQSHRGFFPGFDGFELLPDTAITTGLSGTGQTVEARYWILLDGNFTEGKTLTSPAESKDPWPNLDPSLPAVDQQKVTTENYSYAMVKIATLGTTNPAIGANRIDQFRREEWRDKQNSLAPVISDRLAAGPSSTAFPSDPDTYQSIHDSSQLGKWVGSVGYGDLHTEFEKTPLVATRISDFNNEEDDLFSQVDTSPLDAADAPKNAAMTYDGRSNPYGPIQ